MFCFMLSVTIFILSTAHVAHGSDSHLSNISPQLQTFITACAGVLSNSDYTGHPETQQKFICNATLRFHTTPPLTKFPVESHVVRGIEAFFCRYLPRKDENSLWKFAYTKKGYADVDVADYIALILLSVPIERQRLTRTHNQSPLHICVKYGSAVICQKILEDGADVNSRNNFGMTPLMNLTERKQDGHIKLAELLVRYGAKLDATDNHGCNGLHHAALNNAHELHQWLAQRVKDQPNNYHETAEGILKQVRCDMKLSTYVFYKEAYQRTNDQSHFNIV